MILQGTHIGANKEAHAESVLQLAVQYRYLSDGSFSIRKGIRDNCFVVDISLTSVAFNGVEDLDWENIKSVQ